MQGFSSSDPALCSVLHRQRMHFSPHILHICMRGLIPVTSCDMKRDFLAEYEEPADVFH